MKKLMPPLILLALLIQTVSFALPLFAQDEPVKSPESYLTDDEKAWVAQARANLGNMKNNLTYHRVIMRNYNTQDWAEWRAAYYRSWQAFYPEDGWEGPGGTRWCPPSFNSPGYQVDKAYVSNVVFSSWEAQYEEFSRQGVQPSSATQLQWLAQEEAVLQGLPEKIAADEALLNARIAAIAAQRQKEQDQQKQQEEQETREKAGKFQEIIDRAQEIRDMLVERILMFLINRRSSKSTGADNQTKQGAAVTQGTNSGAGPANELDETDIGDLRYCRIMYKLHAVWASGNQTDPYAGHEVWAYVDGRFNGLVYTGESVYTYPNSTLPIKMKYEVTLHRDQSGKIQSADIKYYYETTDSIQTPPRGPDVVTNIKAVNVPRKQDREEKWTQYFEVTGDQVMSCLDAASTFRTAAFNPKGACCWVTKWSANKDSFIRIELSPSIPKPR